MGKFEKGKNDLETWCNNNEFGSLLKEQWLGIDENGNTIKMEDISANSHTKVKWHCMKCDNEWLTNPNNRIAYKTNCPLCRGKGKEAILYYWCLQNGEFGENLIQEWTGFDENGNHVDMRTIAAHSSKRVKWKCRKCNEEWTVGIGQRTGYKTYCPYCNRKIRVSA